MSYFKVAGIDWCVLRYFAIFFSKAFTTLQAQQSTSVLVGD